MSERRAWFDDEKIKATSFYSSKSEKTKFNWFCYELPLILLRGLYFLDQVIIRGLDEIVLWTSNLEGVVEVAPGIRRT